MTLNQTIKKLKDIICNHAQINSYYFGDIATWSEFTGIVYRSVVLTLTGASYSTPQITLDFTLWISDRLNDDNGNQTEALNDTLLILLDFISQINSPKIDWQPQTDGKNISFFDDEAGNDNVDKVAGVKFDFSISIPAPKDRCQVPLSIRTGIMDEQGLFILTESGQNITEQ